MAEELEKIFKALGNKTRLDIVKSVLSQKEISCQELMKKFPLSQPTMSHHFGLLLDSGVLAAKKDGVRHYYSVDEEKLELLGVNIGKIKGR